jgi:hypothetical protein
MEQQMSLLHDIQKAVLQDGSDLGPILLKLRLLASRLGSQPLADWVRYESEGYPQNADVPDYRKIPVSYRATFSGPFGSRIKNAPISPYLIEEFAGKHWVEFEFRESIAAVDSLLAAQMKGVLEIDAADLILVLQGKVYPNYACNAVHGIISRSSLAATRHSVRSRVLELTIELEKSVPEASSVSVGPTSSALEKHATATTQIVQQTIYGNYTSVSSTGAGANTAIAVGESDTESLAQFLSTSGLAEEDAKALAELASQEQPDSKSEPMGPKVRAWLANNLKKAVNGTWKLGVSMATDVVKEALLKYYGLK